MRNAENGAEAVGNIGAVRMIAVRLVEVINVMKRHYAQDVCDMSHTLLLGCIEDSPFPTFKSTATFAQGQLPFVKTVSDIDSQRTVLLDWSEISSADKKNQKCIVFDASALTHANINYTEDTIEPGRWKTTLINRKGRQVNLYEEIISQTWKGFRVVADEAFLFSDSDEEDEPDCSQSMAWNEETTGDDMDRELKRLKRHSHVDMDDMTPCGTPEDEYRCPGCNEVMTNGSQMCSYCVRRGATGYD